MPELEAVTEPEGLVELFSRRPEIHAYGLADLDEPFWSASQWFRRGDAAVGIVPLPGSSITAVYAVSDADPHGSLSLLEALVDRIPARALVTGPIGLCSVLAPVGPREDLGVHLKYVLDSGARLPEVAVSPLGPSDAPALTRLHDTDPGAAFVVPAMLADQSFVGVWEDGDLVAAAGTHVLSDRHRVAAIGGVLTRPDRRGRGLGSKVTAGVCHRIAGRVDTIALNVHEGNEPARRAYERLGFRECFRYEEALV